jgi:hypothetical protein
VEEHYVHTITGQINVTDILYLVMGLRAREIVQVIVQISGVCQKAGELGRLLQLHLFVSHSRISSLECLPEFIVEYARAGL